MLSSTSNLFDGIFCNEVHDPFNRPLENAHPSLDNAIVLAYETCLKMDHCTNKLRKATQELKTLRSQFNFTRYHSKMALYKTQMCHNVQIMGHCQYGSHCVFAHNLSELRSVPSNQPKTP